jgi:hypothetical protein
MRCCLTAPENRLWKQNPQRLREVLAQGTERARIPRITARVAPHLWHALAAGGRRHLQAVENPRPLECCGDRGALRAFAEGGPRRREPAGEDPSGPEKHWECGADASTAGVGERRAPDIFGAFSTIVATKRLRRIVQTETTNGCTAG